MLLIISSLNKSTRLAPTTAKSPTYPRPILTMIFASLGTAPPRVCCGVGVAAMAPILWHGPSPPPITSTPPSQDSTRHFHSRAPSLLSCTQRGLLSRWGLDCGRPHGPDAVRCDIGPCPCSPLIGCHSVSCALIGLRLTTIATGGLRAGVAVGQAGCHHLQLAEGSGRGGGTRHAHPQSARGCVVGLPCLGFGC